MKNYQNGKKILKLHEKYKFMFKNDALAFETNLLKRYKVELAKADFLRNIRIILATFFNTVRLF